MQLEQQVVSLDLAKRLKELGVKQDSAFDWLHRAKEVGEGVTLEMSYVSNGIVIDRFSAFTVAELGELLPWNIASKKFLTTEGGYFVWDEMNPMNFTANTEADARAKMLIYLLENKLITL